MTVEVFLAFIFSALLEMTVTRGEKKIYNTFILGTREREREILIEEAKMNVQNNNNVCLERKFCLLIFHASFTHIYARNICWHYVEWWIISYIYIFLEKVSERGLCRDVRRASGKCEEGWKLDFLFDNSPHIHESPCEDMIKWWNFSSSTEVNMLRSGTEWTRR